MSAPSGPRIGSLFSGTGALDLATMDVCGGSVAWHCQYEPPDKHGRPDKYQYAARILEHHWPNVPNLGDITKVNWPQVESVDILTAGFPCQDLSYAGRGAGIKKGTRSGLWYRVIDAVRALGPSLVVLENVGAIVNRRPGLDVVLADLAEARFDAEWACVRASDIGAPHQRERWFLLAWPADAQGEGLEGAWLRRRATGDGRAPADAHGVGGERDRAARQPAQRHAEGANRAAADTDDGRVGQRSRQEGREARQWEAERGLAGRAGGDLRCSAHPDSHGLREQSVVEPWRSDPAFAQLAGADAFADPHVGGQRADQRDLRSRKSDPRRSAAADASGDRDEDQPRNGHQGQFVAESGAGGRTGDGPDPSGDRGPGSGPGVVEWGRFEPAVRRWEQLTRPAPSPVDDLGRLAPRFVEWMMGLPDGWVCDVSAPDGMTAAGLRNAQLKALGNGVVVQQGAYGLGLLLERAAKSDPEAFRRFSSYIRDALLSEGVR